MARTAFRSLALLGEQLEKTTSRLEKIESISQFLIELAPDEVPLECGCSLDRCSLNGTSAR